MSMLRGGIAARVRRNRGTAAAGCLLVAAACHSACAFVALVRARGRAGPTDLPHRAARIPRQARGGEGRDAGFQVDDLVLARAPHMRNDWQPAVIHDRRRDGTFVVRWTDLGEDELDVELSTLGPVSLQHVEKTYALGDDVVALDENDHIWYDGTVAAFHGDNNTYDVRWHDSDGGTEFINVRVTSMKRAVVYRDYKVGDAVDAKEVSDWRFSKGTVAAVNDDGSFTVQWDGKSRKRVAESKCSPKDMRYARHPIEELMNGQKVKAVVMEVNFGKAKMDYGGPDYGFIEIKRATKELRVGDQVDAWIYRLQVKNRNKVVAELTMFEEEATEYAFYAFENFGPSKWFDAVVVRDSDFGMWCSVRAPSNETALGLIKNKMIENPISVGDSIKVRVSEITDQGMMCDTRIAGFEYPDISPLRGVPAEQWFTGRVVKVVTTGALTDFTHDDVMYRGFIHKNSMAIDRYVDDARDHLSPGDTVQLRVRNVDTGTFDRPAQRLVLTMEEVGSIASMNPDIATFERLVLYNWLPGRVVNVREKKALVNVTDPDTEASVVGVLPISRTGEGYADMMGSILKLQQKIEVRVVRIIGNRVELSMMADPDDPDTKKLPTLDAKAAAALGSEPAEDADEASAEASAPPDGPGRRPVALTPGL